MMRDIKSVEPLAGHRLHIVFDNGVEGELDVTALVAFHGVFEPLHDVKFFRKVTVHPELRVVCWPNGADLDTDMLYAEIAGTPLPLGEAA